MIIRKVCRVLNDFNLKKEGRSPEIFVEKKIL